MNKIDFIKEINAKRKENKNKWYMCVYYVDGNQLAIKFYNTWVQRLDYKSQSHSNNANASVKDFNNFISEVIK